MLRVPAPGRTVGAQVRLKILAREVMLAADAARGVVTVSPYAEAGGDGLLPAQVTANAARRLALARDKAVLALVKSVSVVVMTRSGGADGD